MFLHPLSMDQCGFHHFAYSTAFHRFSLKVGGAGHKVGLTQSDLMGE